MPERTRGSWRRLAGWVRVKTSSLAVLCLLAIACLGSPTASAALCSNVFPQDATPDTGSTLDLAVMDRQAYGPFPSRGAAYATAGDYFYNAGKLDNGKTTVREWPEALHEIHNGPDKGEYLAALRGWLDTQVRDNS